MTRKTILGRTAVAASVMLGVLSARQTLGGTYTWVGPYAGTSDLWSNSASWTGSQVPVSSSSTTLSFSNFDSNTYTATNDLAYPSFSLNNLTLQNWSLYGVVTLDSVNNSGGTNQIQLTGPSPVINASGPSAVNVGVLSSGTGYGLFLNPTSGSTNISDSGNGLLALGSTNSGINGSGGIVIDNSGLAIVQLLSPTSGNTSSFTGGVNLLSGSLSVGSSLALGDPSNVLTFNGGNLRFSSSSFANPILAASDAVIFSGSSTLQGVISGNGGLHIYNGVAYSFANVTVTNTETYHGATTIDNGPLQTVSSNLGSLTLSPTASIVNTSAINIGQRGSLTFTAGATNSVLPSAAPIALTGAYFNVIGNSSSTAESLGAVANGGMTTLTYSSVSSGATNALNFGALTRTNHSTLFLRGNWLGTANTGVSVGIANFSSGITTVSDSNAPAGYAPIVPFAVGNVSSGTSSNFDSFVTSTNNALSLIPISGTGVTQYTSLTGGFAGLPSNDVYFNVNTTGTVTMSGNAQVYALATSPGGISSLTINGSGTLNIASGVLVATGTTMLSGPTVNFGTNTGYIHLGYDGTSLTIRDTASPILGSNGIVVSGPSGTTVTETFQFSDTGTSTDSSNPFTGGLTVNGGAIVNYTNDLQLGAAGQSITLNGGMLDYNPSGTSTVTMSRPIFLDSAGGGVYTINTNTAVVSSLITGPGAFYLSTATANTGLTVLANNSNNYSGGTYIYSGTLQVSNNGQLGAAGTSVVLAGGTLKFGAPTTLNRAMSFWSVNSNIDTNGFAASITGALTSTSPTTGFTKLNSGTLSLTAASPLLSGPLTVQGGTLALSGNGMLPMVPNVTVASGATLQFDNSGTNLNNRYSSLGRITLNGGTVDLLGNSSVASTQTIGGINLTSPTANSGGTGYVSAEPATAALTASGIVVGVTSYSNASGIVTQGVPNYTSVTGYQTSLTKIGTGTLVLSGTNNIPAGVNINAGTVQTGNVGALGFGAINTNLVGSTAVAVSGTFDIAGKAITEPIALNGGSLTNSSATPATITSGVKGFSFNFDNSALQYSNTFNSGSVGGSGGVGYLPTDTVTATGGAGASANLILGLTAASFNIADGGNYLYASTGPNVTISSSNGQGIGATATATIDNNGTISQIVITNPGSGYTAAPNITITATGSYNSATISGNTTGFGVVGIQQTTAGTGYTTVSTAVVNTTTGSGLSLRAPAISSITLNGTSNIGGVGDITVQPSITGNGGLTKIGSDTVTLSQSNSYSGNTTINAGLVIASGGLASLGTGSLINVNGGDLILRNTSVTTVYSLVKAGFNGGSWNANDGISSTTAGSDTSHLHAVGIYQPGATTTFEGQSIAPSDVAIKYTYYGDANLDGKVDGSDYSLIDNGLLRSLTGWQNGDFNFDGSVNGSDYTLIDNAFNTQGAQILLQIAQVTAQVANPSGSSAVPEPCLSTVALVGAMGFVGRYRRNRRAVS